MADDTRGPEDQRVSGVNADTPNLTDAETHPVDYLPPRPQGDDIADELERQARETLNVLRESAGDLGARVRQALDWATDLWDEANPAYPGASSVTPEEERHARALAKRWVGIDFLVDPEMPQAMQITAIQHTAVWKAELYERGETRLLSDGSEPYRNANVGAPGPVLPVWDYDFGATPTIEAGERRERLSGTSMIGACLRCNGTGHRSCRACDGKGFVQCPICHGRSRLTCPRCRGRGRIQDPILERRARASKSYIEVRAERLAQDAGGKIADFAEKLRQDYGVPLPPAGTWAPAPAESETIPCPECVNGSIACSCGAGKLVCDRCHGTSAETCDACSGSGRVIRYREVVRRFDTRITEEMLPRDAVHSEPWFRKELLRQSVGERVWEGPVDILSTTAPANVPPPIWRAALDLVNGAGRALQAASPQPTESASNAGERRVIARSMRLMRVPLTRVEYNFAGQAFSFVAVGGRDNERFWAQTFPPRWGRVGRFFKALTRDLAQENTSRGAFKPEQHAPRSIEEFRARRERIIIPQEDVPTTASQQASAPAQSPESPHSSAAAAPDHTSSGDTAE